MKHVRAFCRGEDIAVYPKRKVKEFVVQKLDATAPQFAIQLKKEKDGRGYPSGASRERNVSWNVRPARCQFSSAS